MKRLHIHIILLLLATSLSAQQWHTTIDRRHQAMMPLDTTVEHCLLVNNSIAQPADFGHKTQINTNKNNYSIEIDLSAAPLYCLMGMSATLQDADEHYSVSVLEKTQNTSNKTLSRNPLSQAKVDSLCQLYGADVVIELDQILIYDILSSYLNVRDEYYANLTVYQNTTWHVQYPQNGKITNRPAAKRYLQSDTLIWEATAMNAEKVIDKLPERQTAILDMSLYVGEEVGKHFIATWETLNRYYYENKDYRIILGLDAFRHYEYESALKYWTEAANIEGKTKRHKETRAYAAANLAALYELLGEQQKAEQWAHTATETFLTIPTKEAQQQAANLYWYERELIQLRIEN